MAKAGNVHCTANSLLLSAGRVPVLKIDRHLETFMRFGHAELSMACIPSTWHGLFTELLSVIGN